MSSWVVWVQVAVGVVSNGSVGVDGGGIVIEMDEAGGDVGR